MLQSWELWVGIDSIPYAIQCHAVLAEPDACLSFLAPDGAQGRSLSSWPPLEGAVAGVNNVHHQSVLTDGCIRVFVWGAPVAQSVQCMYAQLLTIKKTGILSLP